VYHFLILCSFDLPTSYSTLKVSTFLLGLCIVKPDHKARSPVLLEYAALVSSLVTCQLLVDCDERNALKTFANFFDI
jgi:hypothetical protein